MSDAESSHAAEPPELPPLDRVRHDLRAPIRPGVRVSTLILCALFAAVMGISAAAMTIFGPLGGGSETHPIARLPKG
jgi:hypothetical protein